MRQGVTSDDPPTREPIRGRLGPLGCLALLAPVIYIVGLLVFALINRGDDLNACNVVSATEVAAAFKVERIVASRNVVAGAPLCKYSIPDAPPRGSDVTGIVIVLRVSDDRIDADLVRDPVLRIPATRDLAIPGTDTALLVTVPVGGVGEAELKMAKGSRSASLSYEVPVAGVPEAEQERVLRQVGERVAANWLDR